MELIKKFSAFSIGPIGGAVISFVTVPLITYFISPEEYGKSSMFTLAQGTVSILIYLGMDQAFVREFNKARNNINKLMSNAIFIPAIGVILLSSLVVLNAKYVSMVLFDTPNELVAIYLLSVMFPFMVIENFALLKIRMEENGLLYSFFTILLKVLIFIITILLFVFFEKSFRSVIYAMALSEIINGTILYFVSINKMKLSLKYLDRNLINKMLKFGLPLVPASMLGWVLTSMDKIMLRTLCTYSELGLYTAAFKIVSVLSIVQTCFTLFWTPVAYRWYENKIDNSWFKNIFELVAFVMSELCILLLIFKNLVAYIIGSDFEQSIYIFPFLLMYPVMYTISEATCVGIGFKRKTAYNILISGIAGAVNMGLNCVLIPILYGKGAAIATGLSYLVFFWMRTMISRKLWYRFPIRQFIFYSVIIIVNCGIHTFFSGITIYIISGISFCTILIINNKTLKLLIMKIKEVILKI